jgi:DNA replication protein DnaC
MNLEPFREQIDRLRIARRADAPPTRCTLCDDTGWAPVEQDGVTRYERCECWRAKQPRFAQGVPEEFRQATLDNYRAMPGNFQAIDAARDFLADLVGDLFIGGLVGSGKTRLAASVLNECWRRRPSAFFVHVTHALRELQPHGDDRQASALDVKLLAAQVLVMDDLGAERDRASDFTRRTLLYVLEARGDNRLRTIWTSNKRLSELAEMQDDTRLVSRIAGRSRAAWINVPDQRLAGAREVRHEA